MIRAQEMERHCKQTIIGVELSLNKNFILADKSKSFLYDQNRVYLRKFEKIRVCLCLVPSSQQKVFG